MTCSRSGLRPSRTLAHVAFAKRWTSASLLPSNLRTWVTFTSSAETRLAAIAFRSGIVHIGRCVSSSIARTQLGSELGERIEQDGGELGIVNRAEGGEDLDAELDRFAFLRRRVGENLGNRVKNLLGSIAPNQDFQGLRSPRDARAAVLEHRSRGFDPIEIAAGCQRE